MRIQITKLKTGITRTPEFERKGLCSFAVNTGTKCGHDCRYCSTGALLRMHHSFNLAQESPFGLGFAIVDPDTPIVRTRSLSFIAVVQVTRFEPVAHEIDMAFETASG